MSKVRRRGVAFGVAIAVDGEGDEDGVDAIGAHAAATTSARRPIQIFML